MKTILAICLCLIAANAVESTYFCNYVSPKNACKPCKTNEDCGADKNHTAWYCWGFED